MVTANLGNSESVHHNRTQIPVPLPQRDTGSLRGSRQNVPLSPPPQFNLIHPRSQVITTQIEVNPNSQGGREGGSEVGGTTPQLSTPTVELGLRVFTTGAKVNPISPGGMVRRELTNWRDC